MLTNLYIKNYALIEELGIDFSPGLSIITGETGAGKSILLGALSLLTGQRVDTAVLGNKNKKCIVEGQFEILKYRIEEFFVENDLDYSSHLLVRREISSTGKSRAFVNDTPVNLVILKDLGNRLVDIHSQLESLNLKDKHFQLNIIDAFSNNFDLVEKYKSEYFEFREIERKLRDLLEFSRKNLEEEDYLKFQFEQLENAKLKVNEQEELEQELSVLSNSEEIKATLSKTSHILSAEGSSVLDELKEIKSGLEKISKFKEEIHDFQQRIESTIIELTDLNREVELSSEKIEYLPARINEIHERLDIIYNLQQKHRVDTVKELMELKDEIKNKLLEFDSYEEKIKKLTVNADQKRELVKNLAAQLSEKRKKSFHDIEARIISLLKRLGIRHAKFKVAHSNTSILTEDGIDDISFIFSANKQSDLKEISKIASGGEISRLMLSLKYIVSHSLALPTIIFDEIDSGISGEIADKMGNILYEMSTDTQIINITHLPQIAGKGKYHYLVYKEDVNNQTVSKIKLLNKEERIDELAKMLSGEELTEAAISNAKELLQN
ncbi:DNA repair protein RecN [Bacteroidota bacterium]